uniref:Uncharacterized protein n=1 Tax=Oryza punctata TaxID=4537 RepID=A0A0E0L9H2_ORYPU
MARKRSWPAVSQMWASDEEVVDEGEEVDGSESEVVDDGEEAVDSSMMARRRRWHRRMQGAGEGGGDGAARRRRRRRRTQGAGEGGGGAGEREKFQDSGGDYSLTRGSAWIEPQYTAIHEQPNSHLGRMWELIQAWATFHGRPGLGLFHTETQTAKRGLRWVVWALHVQPVFDR